MSMEKSKDHLKKFRKKAHGAILEDYPTIEKFCFENDLNKSTVCRFLRGETAAVETLARIAEALGKTLDIDMY